jgi:hypothetical protein
MPEQSNTKSDHRKGENGCPQVDENDGSVGLGSGRRQHRKEEARRNEDCCERHTDSDRPPQRAREDRPVREHLANQRENHDDARVSVPGAEEVLTQWVLQKHSQQASHDSSSLLGRFRLQP